MEKHELKIRHVKVYMEGVKIELVDRKVQRFNRIRRDEEEKRFFYKDGCRYSFRFDKPYKKEIKDTVLKIKTLELPENVQTFNTGTSLDRWTKKRPRLKSSNRPRKPTREETHSSDDEDHLEIIPEETYLNEDEFFEDDNNNPYEIDDHVQKLIEQAAECDGNYELLKKRDDKRGRRKRSKRRVSILLSKPPSPETVQVIRVDVTSNYSLENGDSSEDGDYCERFQNIVDEKEEDKSIEQDFMVMCRRLTLSARERKMENAKK